MGGGLGLRFWGGRGNLAFRVVELGSGAVQVQLWFSSGSGSSSALGSGRLVFRVVVCPLG